MINRDTYIRQIEPFIGKDIIKVLTGIRRSGKSTLLELLRIHLVEKGVDPDNFYVINFEDLDQSSKTIHELHRELKTFCDQRSQHCYLFFDEVQELKDWEKLVNSLRVTTSADIYITGSNSKLLSGELASLLAGRYIEVPVYPLSFKEIVAWQGSTGNKPDLTLLFERFIRFGGFPFIYDSDLSEAATFSYLQDLYQSIMLKDIVARHKIRDVELLNRIFLYFFDNFSQTFSSSSIINYLKNEKRTVSQETVYNYIAYAAEAFLIYLVPRFELRGKKLLSFQEKMYLADVGIREAIIGNNQRDIGQVLENIVFLELLRRGYSINVGKIGEKEVDFIATKGAEKVYYQVAYFLSEESTIEREFSSLAGIQDNFQKVVLSLDPFDRGHEGIQHKNVIEFLLEDWAPT